MKRFIKKILVNIKIIIFSLIIMLSLINLYMSRNDLRKSCQLYFTDGSDNLRYALKPGAVASVAGIKYKINSLGFRDREYSLVKPRGCYRILCVGDSFTFGQGLYLESTYPKVLEKELQRKYSQNIEVINAGVCGYNTYDEYWFIKTKLIRLKPDLIILGFYIGNDPENPSMPFNTEMVIKESISSKAPALINYVKEKNNMKRLDQEDYWTKYRNSIWDPDGAQWKRCVLALENIQNLSKRSSIDFLVLILPVTSPSQQDYLRLHNQLTRILKESDIYYIDALSELITQKATYLIIGKGEYHPNAKMHEIYASVAIKAIEEKGFLNDYEKSKPE